MKKKTKSAAVGRRKYICPVCKRRVAENDDNWDQISETYMHTRCWFGCGLEAFHRHPTREAAQSPRSHP